MIKARCSRQRSSCLALFGPENRGAPTAPDTQRGPTSAEATPQSSLRAPPRVASIQTSGAADAPKVLYLILLV